MRLGSLSVSFHFLVIDIDSGMVPGGILNSSMLEVRTHHER